MTKSKSLQMTGLKSYLVIDQRWCAGDSSFVTDARSFPHADIEGLVRLVSELVSVVHLC
jgi:hypothetical protein